MRCRNHCDVIGTAISELRTFFGHSVAAVLKKKKGQAAGGAEEEPPGGNKSLPKKRCKAGAMHYAGRWISSASEEVRGVRAGASSRFSFFQVYVNDFSHAQVIPGWKGVYAAAQGSFFFAVRGVFFLPPPIFVFVSVPSKKTAGNIIESEHRKERPH